MVRLIPIPKIDTAGVAEGVAFLREDGDDHDHTDEHGTEDRYSLEPQKAHLTGEFVILVHHLRASRLANVIRQGRRQTKKPI